MWKIHRVIQVLTTSSVANEQEYQRFSINAMVGDKALREIYLKPFEMLVKSPSPPGCVMTAYNCVNGEHMDSNTSLVTNILRRTWGFKGVTMSDWGGTNSTVESVIAGCDLEMPGPPELRGKKLLKALESQQHSNLQSAIDASCQRLLELARKLNLLGLSEAEAKATRTRIEYSSTDNRDIELVRKVAAKGSVLLKNDRQVLPLDPAQLANKRVAFLGPNSKIGAPGGGGSASMNPQYLSHPMDAFQNLVGELEMPVEVVHAPGAYSRKWLPLTSSQQWTLPSRTSLRADNKGAMLRLDFFESTDLSGAVHETQFRTSSYVDLFDTAPAALLGKPYSFRLTSVVTPTTSGKHFFGISSVGEARLYVDEYLVIDNDHWNEIGETFYAFGSKEAVKSVSMVAGRSYNVTLECITRHTGSNAAADGGESELDPMHVFANHAGVRLGFLEELPSTLEKDAIELSNTSDYTIIVLGLDDEWESEGYDRASMALPPAQDSLVRNLIEQSTNPDSIIIVNQSGSPVEMPWATDSRASTILQIWYGGQEAGNALADVLLGITPPSGHLPVTWPKKYEDLHFANNKEVWPGVDGNVRYEEGSHVGYRWYLHNSVEPQWWFGHGLSYTTFRKSGLIVRELSGDDVDWEISIEVENVGSRSGEEVVQVYIFPAEQPTARTMVGFEQSPTLQPGEKTTILVIASARDAAKWYDDRWELEAGTYSITVPRHAGELDLSFTEEVTVAKRLTWDP